MRALLEDIRRYRSDFPRQRVSAAGLLARRASLQVIAVYRFGRWLRHQPTAVGAVCLMPVRWFVYIPLRAILGRAYGIRLDLSAEIGPGLYIGHVGGIDVERCVVGDHCCIAQQTRIGPTTPTGRGPIIGNRVWIGAHARVLGPITVGDGATIAAGAHVSSDVPPHSLVAGNPARVVKWFYDNRAILGGMTARTFLAYLGE